MAKSSVYRIEGYINKEEIPLGTPPGENLPLKADKHYMVTIFLPRHTFYQYLYVVFFNKIRQKHAIRIKNGFGFDYADKLPATPSKRIAIVAKENYSGTFLKIHIHVLTDFSFTFKVRGCGSELKVLIME